MQQRLIFNIYCNRRGRRGGGGGGGLGGVLVMMAYRGRLQPLGVTFTGFRKMKGWEFHSLKYI